ncbi:MAG TPA: hypothetical protein VFH73_18245 [Polyangia bacterium]|jgi:hypothetical protein|nr:hypothetical protein [Polyangia bacterium]
MRTIIKTLVLSLSLALATAAVAHAEKPAASKASNVKVDWKRVEQHLREHQQYPATKAELVASCNNLVDFQADEKKWFAGALPERTYQSADEVMKALKAK